MTQADVSSHSMMAEVMITIPMSRLMALMALIGSDRMIKDSLGQAFI